MSAQKQLAIDLAVLFIIAAHVFVWFEAGYIVLTGDLTIPRIEKVVHVWSSNDGGFPFLGNVWIVWDGIFTVLGQFVEYSVAQQVYIYLMMGLSSASMYWLTLTMSRNRLRALLAGIVYSINPYLFAALPFLPMYAILPLILALIVRSDRLTPRIVLLFAISTTFLFLGFPNLAFPIIAATFGVILIIASTPHSALKRRFTPILILLGSCLAFQAWWVLPALFNLITYSAPNLTPQGTFVSYSVSDILQRAKPASFSFDLFEAIRWLGVWAYDQTYQGRQYYPFSPPFFQNAFLIAATLCAPILALSALLFSRDRVTNAIGLTTIVSVFFAKGPNPPLGWIHAYLLQNFPPYLFFRDTNRFMVFVTVGYTYLISGMLATLMLEFRRSRSAKIRGILLIALGLSVSLLSVSSWPLFTGDVLANWNNPTHRGVIIPNFYGDANEWLNTDPSVFSVFTLPQIHTYSSYSWGYQGSDILPQVLDKPVISGAGYGGTYLESPATALVDTIYQLFYSNETHDLGGMISLLNAKYIVLDLSVDTRFYSLPSISTNMELLEEQNDLKLVRQFDKLMIYENLAFRPLVYAGAIPTTIGKTSGILFNDTSLTDWRKDPINPAEVVQGEPWSVQVTSNGHYSFGAIVKDVQFNPTEYPYLIVDFHTSQFARIVAYATEEDGTVGYLTALNPPADAYNNHYSSDVDYTIYYNLGQFHTSISSIYLLVTNLGHESERAKLILSVVSVVVAKSIGSIFDGLGQVGTMGEQGFLFFKSQQATNVSLHLLNVDGGRIIGVTDISPTHYQVSYSSSGPFYLIFSQSYSNNWNLKLDNRDVNCLHFVANGFSNGWLVDSIGSHIVDLIYSGETVAFYGAIITFAFVASVMVIWINGLRRPLLPLRKK